MRKGLLIIIVILYGCNSSSQNKPVGQIVGGPCEGCEAVFEYGDKQLNAIDTIPGFSANNPKLKISGSVFKKDGITPAENVILYIYHTNREGIYETKGDETGWARRHGYIRGWVKTGKDGRYAFYTFRPASYPNRKEPEHIHIYLKEPGRNEYYIDEFLFKNDPLLTPKIIKNLQDRGGSGLSELKKKNGILNIERDIILGLNIPYYN